MKSRQLETLIKPIQVKSYTQFALSILSRHNWEALLFWSMTDLIYLLEQEQEQVLPETFVKELVVHNPIILNALKTTVKQVTAKHLSTHLTPHLFIYYKNQSVNRNNPIYKQQHQHIIQAMKAHQKSMAQDNAEQRYKTDAVIPLVSKAELRQSGSRKSIQTLIRLIHSIETYYTDNNSIQRTESAEAHHKSDKRAANWQFQNQLTQLLYSSLHQHSDPKLTAVLNKMVVINKINKNETFSPQMSHYIQPNTNKPLRLVNDEAIAPSRTTLINPVRLLSQYKLPEISWQSEADIQPSKGALRVKHSVLTPEQLTMILKQQRVQEWLHINPKRKGQTGQVKEDERHQNQNLGQDENLGQDQNKEQRQGLKQTRFTLNTVNTQKVSQFEGVKEMLSVFRLTHKEKPSEATNTPGELRIQRQEELKRETLNQLRQQYLTTVSPLFKLKGPQRESHKVKGQSNKPIAPKKSSKALKMGKVLKSIKTNKFINPFKLQTPSKRPHLSQLRRIENEATAYRLLVKVISKAFEESYQTVAIDQTKNETTHSIERLGESKNETVNLIQLLSQHKLPELNWLTEATNLSSQPNRTHNHFSHVKQTLLTSEQLNLIVKQKRVSEWLSYTIKQNEMIAYEHEERLNQERTYDSTRERTLERTYSVMQERILRQEELKQETLNYLRQQYLTTVTPLFKWKGKRKELDRVKGDVTRPSEAVTSFKSLESIKTLKSIKSVKSVKSLPSGRRIKPFKLQWSNKLPQMGNRASAESDAKAYRTLVKVISEAFEASYQSDTTEKTMDTDLYSKELFAKSGNEAVNLIQLLSQYKLPELSWLSNDPSPSNQGERPLKSTELTMILKQKRVSEWLHQTIKQKELIEREQEEKRHHKVSVEVTEQLSKHQMSALRNHRFKAVTRHNRLKSLNTAIIHTLTQTQSVSMKEMLSGFRLTHKEDLSEQPTTDRQESLNLQWQQEQLKLETIDYLRKQYLETVTPLYKWKGNWQGIHQAMTHANRPLKLNKPNKPNNLNKSLQTNKHLKSMHLQKSGVLPQWGKGAVAASEATAYRMLVHVISNTIESTHQTDITNKIKNVHQEWQRGHIGKSPLHSILTVQRLQTLQNREALQKHQALHFREASQQRQAIQTREGYQSLKESLVIQRFERVVRMTEAQQSNHERTLTTSKTLVHLVQNTMEKNVRRLAPLRYLPTARDAETLNTINLKNVVTKERNIFHKYSNASMVVQKELIPETAPHYYSSKSFHPLIQSSEKQSAGFEKKALTEKQADQTINQLSTPTLEVIKQLIQETVRIELETVTHEKQYLKRRLIGSSILQSNQQIPSTGGTTMRSDREDTEMNAEQLERVAGQIFEKVTARLERERRRRGL